MLDIPKQKNIRSKFYVASNDIDSFIYTSLFCTECLVNDHKKGNMHKK